MKNIVWQPISIYQPGYDFGILLDRVFAEEMINSKIDGSTQHRMNELVTELVQRLGHNWGSPYHFFRDTSFVVQFSLGQNGVWLSVDNTSGRSPIEVFREPNPIKYSSHNVGSSEQAQSLLALVDMWVSYADLLKSKLKK